MSDADFGSKPAINDAAMSDANSESLLATNPTAASDADSMRGAPFRPTVPGFKDGLDWEDLMHYQREYIRGELAAAPDFDKPVSATMGLLLLLNAPYVSCSSFH